MAHNNHPRIPTAITPETLRAAGLRVAAEYEGSDTAQDLLTQIWAAIDRPPGKATMVAGLCTPQDLTDALALAVLIAIEHTVNHHPGEHWARCESARELVFHAARAFTTASFTEAGS